MSKSRIVYTALILIITAAIALTYVAYAQQYGPYIDKLIFKYESEDIAVKDLDAGKIQAIADILVKPENVEFAEKSKNIVLIKSVCGYYDLFVNPVPFEHGFNPFAIPEVRQALNYLIDRNYVVKELLRGYGIPMITHWPAYSPEYARIADFMKVLEMKYQYDFEKAKRMITEALTKAGAELIGGKWYYKGKPIVIKFLIRIEDVRRQIGDYIASQLEKLGFTVERIYVTSHKAVVTVYGGDPRKGEWNLYTEGWALSGLTAYEDDIIEFFYVSPYSGSVFQYYKPSKELIDIAKRLSEGKYKSLEEREELIKKAIELALNESVRIWIAARLCPFAVNVKLKNVTYDLAAGLYTPFAFRTARYDNKIGGTVTVALTRGMFTTAWNPIGGETWLYDILITQYIWDPGMWTNPYTGRVMPVRVTFKVETAGPMGKLKVPPDAMIWNATERRWVKGVYKYATSKVTYRFIFGKWHDGSEMNINDVLAWIAFLIDVASEGSPIYDPSAVTPALATFVEKFRGLRIVNENAIEIYIDYWHVDKNEIAGISPVWPQLPWHVIALIYEAVKDKKVALSDSKAHEWGVPWLDLAKGPSIKILKSYMDKLAAENYVPVYIRGRVTPDEAKARYEAMKAFFEKYGHFYISNGPFILAKVDTTAKYVELHAFRNGYPLRVGYFDWLARPHIPTITANLPSTIVPGLPVNVTFTATLEGKPYDKVSIKLLIINPATKSVVLEKDASLVAPGKFVAKLTSTETSLLRPGLYRLVAIVVPEEAAIPKTIEKPVTVMSLATYLELRLKEALSNVQGMVKAVEDEMMSELNAIKSGISSIQGVAYASIALAIIALAIAIVSLIRKR